jgi:tRNA G37 N-methylase Trm5
MLSDHKDEITRDELMTLHPLISLEEINEFRCVLTGKKEKTVILFLPERLMSPEFARHRLLISEMKKMTFECERIVIKADGVSSHSDDIHSQISAKTQKKRNEATLRRRKKEENIKALLPELEALVPAVSLEEIENFGHVSLGKTVKLLLPKKLMSPEFLQHRITISKLKMVMLEAERVVVKTDRISNEFRVPPYEHLWGVEGFKVDIKYSGASFTFELDKTYWSSTQSDEHKKLVDTFSKGEIVVDGFAGVGPFAVLAAKKGCKVFANDLNPDAHKYLPVNRGLNKINPNNMIVFDDPMDGGLYVRSVVDFLNRDSDAVIIPDHFIINLPASGIKFLKYFMGLNTTGKPINNTPTVHVYSFVGKNEEKGDDGIPDLNATMEFIRSSFNYLPVEIKTRKLKSVSLKKQKYCFSVTLSEQVLNFV